MVSLERSCSDLSGSTVLKIKKIFYFIYKNLFLIKNEYLQVSSGSFFQILPKFTDFVNSNECIGRITSKSMRLQPVFIQKKISSKQWKNEKYRLLYTYIYIYDHGHLFFALHWLCFYNNYICYLTIYVYTLHTYIQLNIYIRLLI